MHTLRLGRTALVCGYGRSRRAAAARPKCLPLQPSPGPKAVMLEARQARSELQEGLRLPFRSALRVHFGDGLRREGYMRRGESWSQMRRAGWALRLRRPACLVLIILAGIGSGFIVVYGLLNRETA
jgi:hypothetical protein